MSNWPTALVDLNAGTRDDLQWQSLALANAFVAAVNERAMALDSSASALPAFTTADIAQSGLLWRTTFQEWIAGAHASFVCRRRRVGGSWTPWSSPGYFTGQSVFPSWDNSPWADFCESAGCSRSGFRRVPAGTDWPANWRNLADAAYSFGSIQSGDLIGPWVFDDLYRMLNELVWTHRPFAWDILERYFSRVGEGQAGDWASAKAAAGAMYPWDWETGTGYPQAATMGDLVASTYIADVRRDRALGSVAGTWAGQCKHADWYVCPQRIGGQFESYGDPPASPSGALFAEGLWHLWRTDTPPVTNAAAFRTPAYLGDFDGRPCPGRDVGNWCACPTVSVPTTMAGWDAGDGRVVLRWDVAGGFDYSA